MKLDIALHADHADVAARVADYARAGFAGAFTLEANRDVFFPLFAAAASGTAIDLYPNVAIAFPRSPMHIAYQAWDLQRLCRGRFALGIGSQIRPHIEKRFSARWTKPVGQMREYVAATKAIFACFHEGAPLDFRGEHYTFTLMTPTFIPAPLSSDGSVAPPPIWVGALGPQMTSAAAEVADGLIVHPFNSERFVRTQTVPRVLAGLARSGRARHDFTLNVSVIACVYDDDERERAAARSAARTNLAFYASTPSYRVTLDAHGWGDLQPELNQLSKQGRWSEMADQITDEMIDTFTVAGSPEAVAAAITSRFSDVADRVSLSLPGSTRDDLLMRLAASC